LRLFNAQRSTLNAQPSIHTVERWTLDVGRWAFSFSVRKVNSAWWLNPHSAIASPQFERR